MTDSDHRSRLASLIRRRRVRILAWSVGVVAAGQVGVFVLEVMNARPADRWSVAGGVAGIGALVFAFIATFVALVAYSDSTQTPKLRFAPLTCSDATPHPNDAAYFRWSAKMTLVNDGSVAARFIAVRVTLEGAEFGDDVRGWPIDPSDKHIVQWDGGNNAIIHPRWNQNVSGLDMWVRPVQDASSFTAKFEVVADRAGTITETRTVKLPEAEST